jgi:8-oxo-dGTP diphosphatase
MFPYHGAGVLFWNKDEMGRLWILMGRRTRRPGKDMWSFPGGGWENGVDGFLPQNPLKPYYSQTASREAREEVELHIQFTPDELPLWRIHIPGFHYEIYSWQMETRTAFRFNYEFSDMQWFSVDGLPPDTVPFLRSQVKKLQRKARAKM